MRFGISRLCVLMPCTWFSWTLSVLTLKLFKGTVSLGVREQLKPAKNAATLLSLHSLIHCTTKRAENDGARESALLLRSSHSLTRSSDRPTGVGLRRTDKWRAGHQSNRRRREAPKLKSPSRCVLSFIRFPNPCDGYAMHIGLLLRHSSNTFGV